MDTFGRRFFEEKGFMVTPHGLTILRHISLHPVFCKLLRHAWFIPGWTYGQNQDVSLYSGFQSEMTTAFSSLPNLTTVGLRVNEPYLREYHLGAWKTVRYSELWKEGMFNPFSCTQAPPSKDVFVLLM